MSRIDVRPLLRKIGQVVDKHQYARLVVPVTNEPTQIPTVYFLTPDRDIPCGGILVIYRHVDLLNSAGIRAFVLHQRRGFRCSWFANNTQVTDVTTSKVGLGDLLVVTEPDVCLVCDQPPGTRHVVLNQSVSLAWKRDAERVARHYITSPDLAGVVTVSDYCVDLIRYAFEGVPVHRIHPGIDPALFHPGDDFRGRRIAYMPRRGEKEAESLLHLLRGRNVLDGWEIVPLDGLTHNEVAERLRTTQIFLSFSYQEGFGLPSAEAMACGNYVIGYHGFGGREFFLSEFSAPIMTGDILSFANAVEDAIVHTRANPSWCLDRGRAASAFVLAKYSLERERNEVVGTYTELMGRTSISLAGAVGCA
ncbi:MAG: glycosyltransferase [Halobacteriota archaeon]